MKTIKQAILGALAIASLGAMSQVDATTTIFRITGSTAYRGAVVNTIHNLAWGGTLTYAYAGSAATSGFNDSSSNAAIYVGTISGTTVEIETYWTGSEAGVQSVSQINGSSAGITLNFVKNPPTTGYTGNGATTATLTSGGTSGIDDPTGTTSGGQYDPEVPDACMADTYQSTSIFHGNSTDGHTYENLTGADSASLTAGIVGVVPFVWVASHASAAAGLTNMTDTQIKHLYSAGYVGLAYWTGNSGDETTYVLAMGRNPDSGTRLTAFADSGFGTTSTPNQFEPLSGNDSGSLISATGSTIGSVVPWPPDNVNGVSFPNYGQSGFNSGGKLAGALGSNATNAEIYIYDSGYQDSGVAGAILVGYLSTGDAATAIGTASPYNAYALSYNGVTLNTSSYAQLLEGEYTFWSYEHMYYRTGTNPIASGPQGIADTLAGLLNSTYATVKSSAMHAQRNADGGAVTPLGY
jgi:hypothetical protein